MNTFASLFVDNWRLSSQYFLSEERIYARYMLLILVVMQFISLGLDVALTYWNKDFLNAIASYDRSAFFHSFIYFAFLAAGIILTSIFKSYLTQLLQLRWRRWLTDNFLSNYLSKHAYYHMSLLKNSDTKLTTRNDNPDQRISVDIMIYIDCVYSLTMGLLNSITTLISYVIVLWSLSGVITIPFTEKFSLHIKGIMVWSALIYAGLGTFMTNLIGRILFRLKYAQEHCEANFRYGLVRLRDHTESVAFYRSESNEQTSLKVLFLEIMSNFHEIIRRKVMLNCFNQFYTIVAMVFPYLIASSRYFSREITFGHLSQIASAFGSVYGSLSFITDSYDTIVQWRSATRRLVEFQYVLNELHTAKQNSDIQFLYLPNEQSMRIKELTIRLPSKIGENNGHILINHLNLVLESHQKILITGSSGVGKSTLMRTLAGIWPYGSGTISMPIGDTVAFLPQSVYCPLGSLRQCLTYPSTSTSLEDDRKIEYLLNLCRMNCWCDRLDEMQDWSQVLSLGEQQKMAFVRILYQKPKWVFLDEATSSLDEESETYLYSMLIKELNYSSIISVGHRNNLKQFHQIQWKLENGHIKVNSLSSNNKI